MAAAVTAEDFSNLQLLLKASSKDVVKEVLLQSRRGPERLVCENTASKLGLTPAQASQLLGSAAALCRVVLFQNLSTPEQILELFPESFHSSLKHLLVNTLLEHSAAWRTEALAEQVSLPRLRGLDWRVDLVTSSESVSKMTVPTLLLQLHMDDSCRRGDEPLSSATVELRREALDTMLDGLGRIRDQLSAVASK